MTVSYTAKVSSAKSFGCFLKLLFRWRGSIYKLVWPDLGVFLTAFFSLSFLYRFVLTDPQQRIFERIAAYCDKYGTLIPVSFVLGFYVTIVVGRWWQQYQSIPWIDTLAIWVNSNVHGLEEKDRLLRRTILRYACLAITQCFTLISPRVKKRFPTLDNFVESGLLLENEKEMIAEINKSVANRAKFPTHWIPLVWATSIVTRARTEEKIKNDSAFRAMMDEINKIKDQCAILISFDWISVPLVYTQVVTLAVYVYFFSCIMGRQWVKVPVGTAGGSGDESETEAKGQAAFENQNARSANIDLFFPVFTVLQFFFYMGWLKVAESLLCPFGDDDDDFELNWIVDRNIQVAYLIVDEMHLQHPDLLKDQYWEVVIPEELPHTQASEQYKELSHVSSTANLNLLPGDTKIFRTSSIRSTIRSHHPDDGLVLMPGTPKYDRGSIKGRPRFGIGTQHSTSTSLQSQMDPTSGGAGGGSKINRIGSAFRKIMTREKEQEESVESENPISGSYKSQSGFAGSTRRLNNEDVIPELDENMITIVSNKSGQRAERRPTAQEVFSREREEEYAPIFVMESDSDLESVPPPTSFDSMTVKGKDNTNPTSQDSEERDALEKVVFY